MFEAAEFDAERLMGQPTVDTIVMLLSVDSTNLDADDATAVAAGAELAKRLLDAAQLRALASAAGRRRVEGELSEVGQELSAATNLAPRTASCRTDLACSAVSRLPRTLGKLEAGRLTLQHVDKIEQATRDLTDEQARQVDAQLPPGPYGLKKRLMEAIARINPELLDKKAEKASGGRTVEFWTDALEGTAGVGVCGPIAQVAQIKATIDSLARQSSLGDGRTLNQRRFDAVHDWARSLLGLESVSPATPTGSAAPADPHDEPSADAGRSGCGACGRTGPSTVPINVTISLESLLRLSEAPGDLDGEPIPASVARELAADGRWRRWVTESNTGRLLDIGSATYRPGAALARFVRGRDRTCRFPSCNIPASRCDLDHTKAFHTKGGPTTEANLGSGCRSHHRLKEETSWSYQRSPNGDTAWTAPSGRTYTKPAETFGDDPALNEYLTRDTARRRQREQAERQLIDSQRPNAPGAPDPWTTPPDPDEECPF